MNTILQNLSQLDGSILLFIQAHLRSEVLTPFMIRVTHLGNMGILWIILGILLLIPRKTRRAGLLTLLSLAVTYGICNLWLKNYIARVRPYEVLNGLQLLIEKQKDLSFPSGHASSGFAASVAILKNTNKGFGVPCVILAALIAASRLYVGVHYPSDVIAGILIGTFVALILFWLFGDKQKKYRKAGK